MKKTLLSILLFAYYSVTANVSTLSMLNEVNAEWKNNFDGQLLASSVKIVNNKSFNDWIATHLMLVEQTLRQRSMQHLNAAQTRNRLKLLDELNSYWHAGIFPVNDYLPFKNPVFIDRVGTHCAVGYLMQQSGAEALAEKIDSENKFVYVKAIKTTGVSEWANENGFTIDELAWIQPGYPVAFTADDMAGGLNGNVRELAIDPASQLIYAGGSFNASIAGSACNGVAVYMNDISGWNWVPLGNGVNGTINALLIHNNKLYAGGEFTMAGTVPAKNVAVYDLATMQWQSMGSLDSTVNSFAVYNNEIYAGGRFTGLVSKWTGSQWQDITSGFIYNGEARTLEVYNNELIIGGNFELLTGAIRKNVAAYDGTYMNSSGFGTVTPVNDFEIYHDTLYAACDIAVGPDTCALARFVNSDWEVVIKPYYLMVEYYGGTSIRKLSVAQNRLFGIGDFFCSSGLIYGNRMMEIIFDPSTGDAMCIPLIIVDSTVHTMVSQNDIITFGGDFITAYGDSLNHVGQLMSILSGIPNITFNTANSFVVFPNPANDRINVQLNNFSTQKVCYVKILNSIGKEIYNQKITGPVFSMDLSGKSAGIYTVQVVDEGGVSIGSKRVIME